MKLELDVRIQKHSTRRDREIKENIMTKYREISKER